MNTFPFMGMRVARNEVVIGHYFEKGVYKEMTFDELFTYVETKNVLPKTLVRILHHR